MVPDIDNLQENKPKSSDSHSLPVHETFLSFSNMAVRANPSDDALEIGVLFIASAELPLSTESPYCADSSTATSMPPAATAAEDSGIETPLSVSSSLPQYSTNSSSTPTGYEAIESTSIITPLGLNFKKSFLSGCLHHKIKLLTKFRTHSFSGSG
ncbi:hypothetical protein QTP88_023708 [Uroleucon formosanum]